MCSSLIRMIYSGHDHKQPRDQEFILMIHKNIRQNSMNLQFLSSRQNMELKTTLPAMSSFVYQNLDQTKSKWKEEDWSLNWINTQYTPFLSNHQTLLFLNSVQKELTQELPLCKDLRKLQIHKSSRILSSMLWFDAFIIINSQNRINRLHFEK